jgi:hypothetical protein
MRKCREIHPYIPIKITSPSTLMGMVFVAPLSAPCASPVSSEITQLCKGQVTEVPWMMPWLRGPFL